MIKRRKLLNWLLVLSMLAGTAAAGNAGDVTAEELLTGDAVLDGTAWESHENADAPFLIADAEEEPAAAIAEDPEEEEPAAVIADDPAEEDAPEAELSGNEENLLWDGAENRDVSPGEDMLLEPEQAEEPVLTDAGEDLAAELTGGPGDAETGLDTYDFVTMKASEIKENSDLHLNNGYTVLMMDVDLKLRSISGKDGLEIRGDHTLTVSNPMGDAIALGAFYANAPLVVNASKNGIKTDYNLKIGGEHEQITCVIKAGESALTAHTGSVRVNAYLTAETYGKVSPCIKAGAREPGGSSDIYYHGDIFFDGGIINISSQAEGLYTVSGDIRLSGNCTIVSKNAIAVYAARSKTLSSIDGNIMINNGLVKAEGKTYGIKSEGGEINIFACSLTASGQEAAIYDTKEKITIVGLPIVEPPSGKVSGATIVDSKGKTAAFVKIQNMNLAQLGEIVYANSAKVGNNLVLGFTGELLTIRNKTPEKLHYQWQRSDDGTLGWTDISKATTSSYTPVAADARKYIRIVITADGYTGEVSSAPVMVLKRENSAEPVRPNLAVQSPYTSITVTNANTMQEYLLANAAVTPDWSKAVTPSVDGKLTFDAKEGKSYYVYTRRRETDTLKAGEKYVYAKIFNGYVTSLADLTLDESSVSTRVGEVTCLTVSPLPSDYGGWKDTTVTWYVSGSGVSLYQDSLCHIPVTLSTPVTDKRVYVKATAMSSYAQVNVQKQVGYTDVRRAYCNFEIADASGRFVLQELEFEKISLRQGETANVFYTTKPANSLVGTLSFVKTQGPSVLNLEPDGEGRIKISVPGDAPAGVYYYEVRVDGERTPVTSAIRITVVPKDHAAYCPTAGFTDVKPLGSAWYHEDVDYVVEKGYMTGTSTTTFAPNSTLTRAMVVTILYRMAGSPAVSGTSGFSDVPSGKWYANAVTWAKNKGIATGYNSKTFGPEDPVTREQMVTFLYRYAGKPSGSGSLSSFTDAGKVGSWALDAMKWAVGKGIIKGSEGKIDPGGKATRAQFAAIVHRYESL